MFKIYTLSPSNNENVKKDIEEVEKLIKDSVNFFSKDEKFYNEIKDEGIKEEELIKTLEKFNIYLLFQFI